MLVKNWRHFLTLNGMHSSVASIRPCVTEIIGMRRGAMPTEVLRPSGRRKVILLPSSRSAKGLQQSRRGQITQQAVRYTVEGHAYCAREPQQGR